MCNCFFIFIVKHDYWLIGIIDYEFNKQQNRRMNNISINPDQIKEIILDKGDRLITIANFNNLEMVNNSQWLHIL